MITCLLWVFICCLLKVPVTEENLNLFIMLGVMSDLNFFAKTGK